MFPNEELEETGKNSLLNTIRIPKNIMYLSDKLPRPTYKESKSEAELRSTGNAEKYAALPSINPKKKPKQIILFNQQEASENCSPTERQYKIPKYKPKKNKYQLSPIDENKLPNGEYLSERDKGKDMARLAALLQEKGNKKHENLNLHIEKSPQNNAQDPYIYQLVNKKNPIIRNKQGDLQKLAGIYAGSNVEQIISLHKKYSSNISSIEK